MTRRLTGLVAVLGLLAVVAGVPWLLLAIGASPIPAQTPSIGGIWDSLTRPDGGSTMLTVFRYAAWLAWLFFVVCLVIEAVARVTGREVPQLPGLSLPQGAARGLISAALMLFVAAPAVTAWAGTANAAPAATASITEAGPTSESAAAASTGAVTGATVQWAQAASAAEDATERPERATTSHEVVQGETLWSIAESKLGDGTRYTEILELNPGTITSSHWINPGTTIELPADDTTDAAVAASTEAAAPQGTQVHVVERGDTLWDIAEDELGEGSRYPEIVAATGDVEQPDGRQLTDPDLIIPGWELQVPGASGDSVDAVGAALADAPRVGALAHSQKAAAETLAATHSDAGLQTAEDASNDLLLVADPATWWSRNALGLGGITAAGVLALLEATRRRRARHLATPSGDGDPRELALGLVADGHTARTIDLALRHIAHSAAAAGRAVPGLRSVRMSPLQLDVQLADPMQLPAPWTSTADPRLWTLAAERATSLDAESLDSIAPPFPGLVTIGQDDEAAYVLVNALEARTFTVAGRNEHIRDAVAAMTLDLATAPWAESTVVTVVGGDSLIPQRIASGRIRWIASASDHVLADEVTLDTSAREIIVTSGDLSAADRRLLETAAASSPRVALVQALEVAPEGAHSLTISANPEVAVLAPAYLQVRPQLLSEGAGADLVELFDLASASTAVWAPAEEPTLATIGAGAPAMGAPGIVIDGDDLGGVDDMPTVRRSDLAAAAAAAGDETTPTLWNTPVTGPRSTAAPVPGDDVATVRRSALDTTAPTQTPGWLSVQITPTPGTPLPPVIAFPQRVRELLPPTDAPVLRLLGPVDIDNVGDVDPVHRPRLTELAAFLNLHPAASDEAVDDAMWPNRSRRDHSAVRSSSLGALGLWLAGDPEPAAGRSTATELTSDWDLWRRLLPDGPAGIAGASTERLEQGLGLVRGRPFVGKHPRHYLWADPLISHMVHAITLAAAELARRHLMAGQNTSAYDATVVGLTVEPSVEALWRMQILAAKALGDREAEESAIAGLHDMSNALGDPIDDRTADLLRELAAADAPTHSRAG